jgi:hypothetical protein
MAHAKAAIGLVHQHPGEAHFGHLLPQAVAKAILAIAVTPVAQALGDIAFLGNEAARGVGEHRLIVVMIQGHWFSLPKSPLPPAGGAARLASLLASRSRVGLREVALAHPQPLPQAGGA